MFKKLNQEANFKENALRSILSEIFKIEVAEPKNHSEPEKVFPLRRRRNLLEKAVTLLFVNGFSIRSV